MSAGSSSSPAPAPAADAEPSPPQTAGADGSGLKELPVRILAAATVLLAIVLLLILDVFLIRMDVGIHVVYLLFVVQGLREFFNLCDARGMTPFRRFGILSGCVLVCAHWASMPGVLGWMGAPPAGEEGVRTELLPLALVLAVFGTFLLQANKRDNSNPFSSIGATLLGLLYVWFLSSFLVKIRHLGLTSEGVLQLGGEGSLATEGHWVVLGTWLLLHAILVTKSTDIFAYILGRLLGRRKMIRRISPGKTWEGLAFGLAGSALVSIAFQIWVLADFGFTLAEAAVFGVIVGAFGQGGDLAESLLKRSAGAKDAGRAVPGFGGVLDLIDSLLSGAPVAYFLYLILLGGTT